MFVSPSFDPKTMSDDELVRRVQELDQKMGWMTRFGGSMEALQQMQAIRALIDTERRERVVQEIWSMRLRNPDPVMIETDPDLRAKEQPEPEPELPLVRPRPTRRPIQPSTVPMPTRTPKAVAPTSTPAAPTPKKDEGS